MATLTDPDDASDAPTFEDPIDRATITLTLDDHGNHVRCFERAADEELVGRGETHAEAVRNYAALLTETADDG